MQIVASSSDFQGRKKAKGKPDQVSGLSRESKTMKQRHKLKEEPGEGKGKEDVTEQPTFKFKRRKGEGMRHFLQRVDQETDERILAAHKKLKKSNERRKK